MASATTTGAGAIHRPLTTASVARPMMTASVGSPVLQNLPPTLSASNKGKPVPMKLFATWEVERTPPNCIPRLCHLTLARLVLYKPLDSELNSIVIAVKMQSCKRTLRSNEIGLPSTGFLDTELELTFCLQYPHFLKREGNTLQIMLQRRKKYKNRTILGYKTLGTGLINMSHVLQREMEQELELVDNKGGGGVLGKVYMQSLTSQPVDHEEPGKQMVLEQVGAELYSEDEDEYTSPEEASDSEPMLDRRKSSKPNHAGLLNSAARQRNIRQKFVALLRRFKVNEPEDVLKSDEMDREQRGQVGDVDEEINYLLDQLEDYSDSGPDVDTISVGETPKPQLRPFFGSSRSSIRDALENPPGKGNQKGYSLLEKTDILSDRMSDDSSGKGGVSDSQGEVVTDQEASDTPGNHAGALGASPPQSGDEKKTDRRSKLFSIKNTKSNHQASLSAPKEKIDRLNSSSLDSASPRKVLLEQLSRMLPQDDDLPDQIVLANTGDPQASHLASKLTEHGLKVICTACSADVRAVLTCLVTRIQKFCNTSIKPPNVLKIGLIGSDAFINSMLRPYVELFTSKPPDWQYLFTFYIIPLASNNSISKDLGARCPVYNKLFQHDSWRDLLEKAEPSKQDVADLVSRVHHYLNSGYTTHLKIAEAMVTYKEKCSDEDSDSNKDQATRFLFVPFLSDVRVGNWNELTAATTAASGGSIGPQSADCDDHLSGTCGSGSGSGIGSSVLERSRGSGCTGMEKITPPSSPSISKYSFELGSGSVLKSGSNNSHEEGVELQLDYWLSEHQDLLLRKSESEKSKKQDSKLSIRNHFRSLVISNLPAPASASTPPPDFFMKYTTKEKRGKAVLKLGKKKEKVHDSDNKIQNIEGINRLICSTVKSSHLIKVFIDGQEWTGVKFFQLSNHWQTHTKQFPVAVASEVSLDL